MLIKFKTRDSVSTMRISDTEEAVWRAICKADEESLNETVAWLWDKHNRTTWAAGEVPGFTQWARDQFLIRAASGEWFGSL